MNIIVSSPLCMSVGSLQLGPPAMLCLCLLQWSQRNTALGSVYTRSYTMHTHTHTIKANPAGFVEGSS